MLDLSSFMIGTSQIDAMAAFYEKVIGRPADMVQDNWHGWQIGKAFLGVGEHSEVAGQTKEPERLMFNFETKDVVGEFERIKGLGATVIKEPYQMGEGMIATFSDPDGNYFQLMTPWDDNA